MTTPICYTVTATLPDEAIATSYIRWLEDGHVDAVVDGGAHSGMIVRLDQDSPDDPIRVQTVYLFPTRAAYDRYVLETAPALREDGIKRFGAVEGVSFSRTIGAVV